MVAIKSHDADQFLAKASHGIFAYLIFGGDEGLVSERTNEVLRASVSDARDSMQVLRFSGDALAGESSILAEEFYSVPMFGDRRAFCIQAGNKNLAPVVEPLLPEASSSSVLIVSAGSLKRDSALRKLFEASKFSAAIECYSDSERDLARVINDEMIKAGHSISEDARARLVSLLGSDRLITRSEISKLVCYASGKANIDLGDVLACVADASIDSMDSAIDDAFSGSRLTAELTHQALQDDRDVAGLLAATLRHSILLLDSRLGAELAHESNPPHPSGPRWGVSFARKANVEKQIQIWTADRLLHILSHLEAASLASRRDAKLALPIAARALLAIASASRSKPA